MDTIYVKLYAKRNELVPVYATPGSSGFDLKADIEEPIILKPLERIVIPTGLYIELPLGYECQIRPRTGNSMKLGLTCINSPGTIDSDYRGELGVLAINLSNKDITVIPGMKVAQGVIQKVSHVGFLLVDDKSCLSDTERGEGAYGHSDK